MLTMQNNLEKLKEELNLDKVPKFTQIRLETTNNCGYKCFMCPRRKMTRKIGEMSIDDLNLALDRLDYIKYELDFHLHGYGEALLCKTLPQRCGIITKRKLNFNPLIYTTLGYKKEKSWLEDLFKNGLRTVIVSLYGYDRETYKSVHGVDTFDIVKENLEFISSLKSKYYFKLWVCIDDFKDKYPLPKGYNKKKFLKLREEFINYLKTLNIDNISGQILHNFGDGFNELSNIDKKLPCSICWGNRMQHLSISWDLNVHPCAYDYDVSVVWGNLKTNTLQEIFNSSERKKFLESHLIKKENSEGGGGAI